MGVRGVYKKDSSGKRYLAYTVKDTPKGQVTTRYTSKGRTIVEDGQAGRDQLARIQAEKQAQVMKLDQEKKAKVQQELQKRQQLEQQNRTAQLQQRYTQQAQRLYNRSYDNLSENQRQQVRRSEYDVRQSQALRLGLSGKVQRLGVQSVVVPKNKIAPVKVISPTGDKSYINRDSYKRYQKEMNNYSKIMQKVNQGRATNRDYIEAMNIAYRQGIKISDIRNLPNTNELNRKASRDLFASVVESSLPQFKYGKKAEILNKANNIIAYNYLKNLATNNMSTLNKGDKITIPYGKGVKKVSKRELMDLIIDLEPKQDPLKNLKPGQVAVNGVVYTPKSEKERSFYLALNKHLARDNRFKALFTKVQTALGLEIKDQDKWWSKAIKGVGNVGVGLASLPLLAWNVLDKATLQIRGRYFSGKELNQSIKREQARAREQTTKEALPTFVKSLDPTKPENWAGIALTIIGFRAGLRSVTRAGLKTTKGFVPSVRNASEMKSALVTRQTQVATARKLARQSIKAKSNVRLNTKLLKNFDKLDNSITKSIKEINKIIKDPKVLKLIDMNPLVKTADLLKTVGKQKYVFHATSATPKSLFGQVMKKLKSPKEIVKAVQEASGKLKRDVPVKTAIEKSIIDFVKQNKGVLGGGKAQNSFVKFYLKRATGDFDVLIKNASSKMNSLVKQLRRKFPNTKFEPVVLKQKGFNVYRLKVNGKVLVDFDPISKGLKYQTSKGLRYMSPKQLALNKLEAIQNPLKKFRWAKDTKDLRKLTGNIISDKKFMNKYKNPRNVLEVIKKTEGMGKSRIKFGETQMFFDYEVATGYAYKGMMRQVIPKAFTKWLSEIKIPGGAGKIAVPKSFIKKLNSFKYIKASDKFTILKMKAKISDLPAKLRARVKLASQGKLSSKQSVQLRKDLNSWVNKNPQKMSIGSRTGSQIRGERETVLPVGSKVFKQKYKFTYDPETKIYINVLETSLKRLPKKANISIIKRIRAMPKETLQRFVRNFSKGDISKVRKYNKLIKRADYLTSGRYMDFIEFNKRLFASKFAKAKGMIKRSSKAIKRRKTTPIVRRRSTRELAEDIGAITRRPTRPKVRPSSRTTIRPQARTKPRAVKRPSTRLTGRAPTRVAPRTTTRPRSRARTPVRPRVEPRVTVRPRPRPRPRVPIRPLPRKILRRIPKRFRRRITSNREKEELIKWLKEQPIKYRPSLVAVLYEITSYKIPKSSTGIDIRPMIIARPRSKAYKGKR